MKKATLFPVLTLLFSFTVSAHNWMSRLPDNMYVALVTIPGSHDAATGNGFPATGNTLSAFNKLGSSYAKTQDITLDQQWTLGVRAFDFRPYVNNDTLNINHGIIQTNLDFDEALYMLRDSLIANPTEFAVIHMLYATNFSTDVDAYKELLVTLLQSDPLKDYIIDFRRDLTVGDVRGKILILSRDIYDTKPIGAFMTGWAGYISWEAQTAGTVYGAGTDALATSPLYMQDLSDTSADGAVEEKIQGIQTMLDFSTTQDVNSTDDIIWIFNFASAYTKTTTLFGNELSMSDGYRENATYTHPAIIEYFQNNDPGPAGIVLCDYIGTDYTTGNNNTDTTYYTRGKELLDTLINNNFNYLEDICRPIYNTAIQRIERAYNLLLEAQETVTNECPDVATEYLAQLQEVSDSLTTLKAQTDSLYQGYLLTDDYTINYSAFRKWINNITAAAEEAQAQYLAEKSTPLFQHRFVSLYDESGTYQGTLGGSAEFATINDVPVINLGTNDGYFSFGADMGQIISTLSSDYTLSLNIYIPETTTLGANGNFVFNFGNSSTTGYIFFGANTSRCSITPKTYSQEQTVDAQTPMQKGQWHNLVYTQADNAGTIYIDGQEKATAGITMHPSELGTTTQNWLGRSPYTSDVYLQGAIYSDVRIYSYALTEDDIQQLNQTDDLQTLRTADNQEKIDTLITTLDYDFTNIRTDLTLPTTFDNDITGTWTSSDQTIITDNGQITRPQAGEDNATCTLTLTLTLGQATATITFPATVCAQVTDEQAVINDLADITLTGNLQNLSTDLTLTSQTADGSIIIWESSNQNYLTSTGHIVNLSPTDQPQVTLTLTATAYKGTQSATRTFQITIAYQETNAYYLFVYFPSNSDENLYYALSSDGFNYTPLNNGQKVMSSDTVAIKKGIRDPHILRGQDGTFYMVATDMRCAEGWSSNRGIVMLHSTDMIHWTHNTVHFPDRFPEQWSGVTRVWAPETIWDSTYINTDGTLGRYMIYYSLLTDDMSHDIIYYSYANDDFTDLLTEPQYFFEGDAGAIDGDIIWYEKDSLYHMIFKNEALGSISQTTAQTLTPTDGQQPGTQWSQPSDALEQTTVAVEGGGLYKLIGSDDWVLMYDCYNSGYYQFCQTSDFQTFTLVAQTTTSGAFTPRHGTVLPITADEATALVQAFPTDMGDYTIASRGTTLKNDQATWTDDQTYHIPAYNGTNLTSVDPQLYSTPGVEITPTGPQDFTDGPVEYTLSASWLDQTKTVKVQITIQTNPVIDGFYAQPDILWSDRTGRFYLYPTTDGDTNHTTLNVFSSTNLVDWQKETTAVDLQTAGLTWTTAGATAPAPLTLQDNDGNTLYYLYFGATSNQTDTQALALASASTPVGPFYLQDQPITQGSQPETFTDPTTNQNYLYYGVDTLTVATLTDPATPATTTDITPQDTTQPYSDGTTVFYRNGTYYFLWSVGTPDSQDYHVAYGTATSPTGPVTTADNPVILAKDTANNIYGPGHPTVICIPQTDDWYIIYHRIHTDYLNTQPECHHEICIDPLEFDNEGNILTVQPTQTGINPVDMTQYILTNLVGTTSVTAISTPGTQTQSTTYYTLGGIPLGNTPPTAKGIYIRVEKTTDGNVKATKVMK